MLNRSLRGVICSAVVLCSSAALYRALAHEAYLPGADAYYYAVQAKYVALTGRVRIPDSSPVHRITGTFCRFGLSAEQALRLWMTLSLFIYGIVVAGLILRGRAAQPLQLLLILCAILSPTALFAAVEFPRMFAMVMVLPLWFYPLSSSRWMPAVFLAVATCALHKSGLPLAGLFSLAAFFAYGWEKRLSQKRGSWFCAAAAVVIAAIFAVYRDQFSVLDWQRFSGHDLSIGLVRLLTRPELPRAIKFEFILTGLLFAGVAKRFLSTPNARKSDLAVCLVLFLPSFFLTGRAEIFGVGERYALLLPLLLLVASGFLSRQIFYAASDADPRLSAVAWACLIVLPLFGGVRLALAHPDRLNPDFKSYDAVIFDLSRAEIPMLVAHRGIAYLYDYRLMRDAYAFEPEDHWNKSRVWRVLYKIEPQELNYYAETRCRLGGGLARILPVPDYILVREDCWEAARSRVSEELDEDLYHRMRGTEMNPARKRPAFLYAKHASDPSDEFPALPPVGKS